MFFLNRATSLDFDDMLAGLSAGAAGGVAYGLFENSEQMALNLGFSGFRRGSYDFYKTDWKYLNDASTRGGMANTAIDGILIPAGTSTVYDQQLGTNIRRPFLHVRYRANQADDRRMKNWMSVQPYAEGYAGKGKYEGYLGTKVSKGPFCPRCSGLRRQQGSRAAAL